jgi:uncharacterized protein (TIGR02300 family)
MGRPELGTKCTCSGCHERFYDLKRSAPICPKCGIQWLPEAPRVSRAPRGAVTSGFQTRQRPTVVVTDDEVEPANTSEDEDEEDEDDDDLHESDDETEADIEIVPDLPKPLTEVP